MSIRRGLEGGVQEATLEEAALDPGLGWSKKLIPLGGGKGGTPGGVWPGRMQGGQNCRAEVLLGTQEIQGQTQTPACTLSSPQAAFGNGGRLGSGMFLNSITVKVQKMAVLQMSSCGGGSKQVVSMATVGLGFAPLRSGGQPGGGRQPLLIPRP